MGTRGPVGVDNHRTEPLVGVEDENRRPPGGSQLCLTTAPHTPSPLHLFLIFTLTSSPSLLLLHMFNFFLNTLYNCLHISLSLSKIFVCFVARLHTAQTRTKQTNVRILTMLHRSISQPWKSNHYSLSGSVSLPLSFPLSRLWYPVTASTRPSISCWFLLIRPLHLLNTAWVWARRVLTTAPSHWAHTHIPGPPQPSPPGPPTDRTGRG